MCEVESELNASGGLKIGCVEEFQGQVCNPPFLSLFFFDARLVEKKSDHHLYGSKLQKFCGLRYSTYARIVANPRRFNGKKKSIIIIIYINAFVAVAITRAQALLIVVGDPQRALAGPDLAVIFELHLYQRRMEGAEPSWDPDEEVNEAGGYDKRVRAAANVEMEEFVKRVREV